MSGRQRRRLLYASAAALLALEVAMLVVQRDWQRGPFVGLALAQGAAYAVAVAAVWNDRDGAIATLTQAIDHVAG